MKKVLRTIIILVLILALFGGGFWYFFIQSSALPASIYASYAAFHLRHGSDASAATYYTKALKIEPSNTDYAIAASKAHREDGNYTKAEYVLVSAIGNNSDDLDLYLELSKTYVEQDKLLDAERLISSCTNESIREQLNAIRPAAPTIEPDGGYASDLTTCSVSGTAGDIYCSDTREYPSLENGAYTDPIPLDYGVTTVSAIAVQDGLVSTLTTAEFTVCGVIEEVTFQDEAFDAMMRELLAKDRHGVFMSTELWDLQEMTISSEDIALDDLAAFIRLETLTLEGDYNLSVLTSLPLLKNLTISGCTLNKSDLETISSIVTLESLTIRDCGLTSLDSLSGAESLVYLDASENQITDISALAELTTLQELNLSDNPLKSIKALAANEVLVSLDVSACKITGVAALGNKTKLTTLDISDNAVKDLSGLAGCTSLTVLHAADNKITDLSPIAALTNLQEVNLSDNLLDTLPEFSTASQIATLDLSNNALSNVDALAALPLLGHLIISNNRVTDISSLAGSAALYQIDANENPLADVSALEAKNIIVNYDPDYTLPEEETTPSEETGATGDSEPSELTGESEAATEDAPAETDDTPDN